jgi:hypothetical protein
MSVSSTGNLGAEFRDPRRYYNNGGYFVDPDAVIEHFQNLEIAALQRPGTDRVVSRFLANDSVAEALRGNQRLEVALPLREHGAWLIYLAKNGEERRPNTSLLDMHTATLPHNYRPVASVIDKLKDVSTTYPSLSFATSLNEADQEQAYALLKSFGWQEEGVAELTTDVEIEQDKRPEDRKMWLAVTRVGQKVVSIAQAQRIDLEGVPLVESTEWRTRDRFQGQGLMTGNLHVLHAQVLNDIESPVIYAETNFASRADRSGHGAGLVIPRRQFAPQVVKQNVEVDGVLTDFSFMSLHTSIMRQLRSAMPYIMGLTEPQGVRS